MSQTVVRRLWLFWIHRRLLWRWSVGGLLLASLIAFLLPKQYESTARLMPPESDPGSKLAMLAAVAGGSGTPLANLASGLIGGRGAGAVFVGVLKSRTIHDRLISRFDLRKVYRVKRWEDARRNLARHTDISEDRKSGIISIAVTDHDQDRAAAMAQAYVDELNKLVAELSTSAARRERIFLEARMKEVQGDLYESEKRFSEFSSKHSTLDIKEQGKAMLTAAAELEGELIAAQSQLKGLKQIYTANNVRVRAAQARVNELKRHLDQLGGAKEAAGGVAAHADTEMPYPSIRELPLLSVTYADLYRHIKVQETVFDFLTKQYEIAKVEEAKEIPTVKILDFPDIPERKSFPPRLLIMTLGALLAFSAGVLWVMGNAAWEETDPQDPRKLFALEVFRTTRARLDWALQNGSRLRAVSGRGRSGRGQERQAQPGD